jgi:hypothetical protein
MRYAQSVRSIAAALALGLTVGLAAPVVAQTITADNVGEMVKKASTAADHTALAEYFTAQAQTAKDNAQKHRTMLVSGPSKSSQQVWDQHCRRLITSFENEAAAYTDLAKEQATLAKHAGSVH